MKRLFYSVPMIVALLLTSCAKEMRFQEVLLADGDKVPVSLTCEPLDFELEEGTKSHLGNNILTKVSNVNYYLFDKEGNFVSQGYTEDLGEFGIALPDIDAHYQCFFFANVGRFAIPETTKASDMGTAVHYDFQSYDNYSSSVNDYGFPMAAGVADFNKVNAGNVTVKRLVHTLRVKINTAALNASHLHVKNVRVRQAPRDFFPFAEKSKLTEQFTDKTSAEYGADWLSAEEVEKINNGEEVRLYILENMRGELIPGNTEWKNKTPQNIENRPEASKATYIEIETWVVTPTANYDNVVYRAYLGKSPSNFDVQRSTSFLLTNVFTSDMIPDEDWRIDPGTPVINASLGFVWPDNDTEWSSTLEYDGLGKNVYVNNPETMVPALEDTYDGPHCPGCNAEDVYNFVVEGETMRCKVCGYFDNTSAFVNFSNVGSFYLTDGFKQVLYIYRSNKNVSYTLSKVDGSSTVPNVKYVVSKYSDKFDKVTFWVDSQDFATYSDTKDEYGFPYLSNGDITGCIDDVPRKVYPVKFKIETPDGLLSQVITCNYFYGPMGCNIYTDESNGALRLSCGNPLQLYVSTTCGGAFETVIPGTKRSFVGGYKMPNDDWYTSTPGSNFWSTDVTMPYFDPGGWSASAKLWLTLTGVAALATAAGVALSFTNPITGGLGVSVAHALGGSLLFGIVGAVEAGGLVGMTMFGIESYDECFEELSYHDYRPFQIVRVPFRRHVYLGNVTAWTGAGVPRNYVRRNQTGASLALDFGMRDYISFSSNYFDQAPSKTVSWSLAESYQKAKNFSLTNKRSQPYSTLKSIPFATDIHYSLILGHWVMDSFEYSIKNGICEKIAGHPEEGTEKIRSYGMDVLSKQRGLIINNAGTSDLVWHTSRWWETSSKYMNLDLIKNVWEKSEKLFIDITPYINDMYGASIYAVDKSGGKFYFDEADYRSNDGSWYPCGAIGILKKYDDKGETGYILDTKRFCRMMGIGGTPGVANEQGVLGLCKSLSYGMPIENLQRFAAAAESGSSELLDFVAADGEEIQSPEDPIIIFKNGSSYGAINMKGFLSTRTNELPGHLSSHPITIGCNESFFAENAAF